VSSRSATTYTHSCDLCGKSETTAAHVSPYRKLYIDDTSLTTHGPSYFSADICHACMDKPIRELVGWFARRGRRR
jgi:hypothetical protein